MLTLDLKPAHLRALLEILAQQVPEAEVWAYGSRVTGGAHEGSDIDLVVRCPCRLNESQKNLARLRDALTESNLPVLVDVLDWARIPDAFRQEIERHHVAVAPGQQAAVK